MGKPEQKKPEHSKPEHSAEPKINAPQRVAPQGKIGCLASGCKGKEERHNFCPEHFNQFKFGLITKLGEKVMDFDKKFDHYQRWLKSRAADHKAA